MNGSPRQVIGIHILLAVLAGTLGVGWLAAQAQAPKAPPKTTKAPAQQAPPAAEVEVIPPAAPDALFPAVVARVNGKAVLGRDLEQRIQTELAPIGNPKWSNLKEDYRQQLIAEGLTALIGAELIYQKAAAGGFKATEAETQAEFMRFSKTFANDAAMNLALANRGLDRAGLMKELARTLTVTKYVEENIGKKITVTPAETAQYYEKNPDEFFHPDMIRTSHILITVPEGATEQQERLAKQRAESVLERARKGEDFAKLAREYSTDASASQGGDLGLTPKGQLLPEYEDAAFALQVGGVSDLVRTQFGYHIIKMTEKKKAGKAALAEIQQQLTDFLKGRKTEQELAKLVDQLRTQARIETYITLAGTPLESASQTSSPRP